METSYNDRRLVTAMFPDREHAEKAYNSLSERGYTKDDVNVIMSDDVRKAHFENDPAMRTELGNKALEGTGTGAAVGTTLGAIVGAVAAIGTNLVLPGLGLIVAGPLAAGLAGAGAGAAAGSITGALIGAGIPEVRVKKYEEGIKDGHIIMGVHTRSDEDADYVADRWKSYDAKEIHR